MTDLVSLQSEELRYFGLSDPAVQIGGVISNTPAADAGLKAGLIITKLDGHPLAAGDNPQGLAARVQRTLSEIPPGATVNLTVLDGKDLPPHNVSVTLEPRPALPRSVPRYWADDFGFGVRSITVFDTYIQRLPRESFGVVTSLVKPDGAAAAAGLHAGDMVLQFNGKKITDLQQFTQAYESFRQTHVAASTVLVVRRDGNEQTIKIDPST